MIPYYQIIPLAQLQEPQLAARVSMDEDKLTDLAGSIRMLGVLQPLIVVPITEDGLDTPAFSTKVHPEVEWDVSRKYRIVAGHRRFLASRMIGLWDVPCMVYVDGGIAEEAAKLAENVHRENLTPAEEGLFMLEYCERHSPTESELSSIFGASLSYIYGRMDFARGPVEIVRANAERKINMGVALELMKVSDEAHRNFLLGHAIEGGATRNVVMGWVVDWRKSLCIRQAEAPGAPVVASPAMLPQAATGCLFCGRTDDAGNMVQVAIHSYEVETAKGMFRKLGVRENG